LDIEGVLQLTEQRSTTFLIVAVVINLIAGANLLIRGWQAVKTRSADLKIKRGAETLTLQGDMARSTGIYWMGLGGLLVISGGISFFMPMLGLIILIGVMALVKIHQLVMRLEAAANDADKAE